MAHLLDDAYLRPFEGAIRGRAERADRCAAELTGGALPLSSVAVVHHRLGLHRTRGGWTFREWAPHASSMWLVGDFNGWKIDPDFEAFKRVAIAQVFATPLLLEDEATSIILLLSLIEF